MSSPGEGRGTATALLFGSSIWASGFPRSLKVELPGLRLWAPGLRIWKPGRLEPSLSAEGAESPLAGHRTASLSCTALLLFNSAPIPVESEFCVLGIAKLLPQIVPVKRETLQVVSLAMTGLVRGSNPLFHIVENRLRVRFAKASATIAFLGTETHGRGWGCRGQRPELTSGQSLRMRGGRDRAAGVCADHGRRPPEWPYRAE